MPDVIPGAETYYVREERVKVSAPRAEMHLAANPTQIITTLGLALAVLAVVGVSIWRR